jgi:phage baseplate assembly protein W
MAEEYFSLPLSFANLIQKKDLERCSIVQSIAQNIHLILTTSLGENRNDSTYGCIIWDNEFEILIDSNTWKNKLSDSIKTTLIEHEKRIENMEVKVDIYQEELVTMEKDKNYRIKRRVDINVKGNLITTNEPYTFFEKFFIGPISYD